MRMHRSPSWGTHCVHTIGGSDPIVAAGGVMAQQLAAGVREGLALALEADLKEE